MFPYCADTDIQIFSHFLILFTLDITFFQNMSCMWSQLFHRPADR